MIHPTFRSLDEAPKLVWFTAKQWVALIVGSGLLVGVIRLMHVPTKPAITVCVFVIGLPAALTYVSESGGLQLSVLLRSMSAWRFGVHTVPGALPGEPCRLGAVVILAEQRQPGEPYEQDSLIEVDDELPWERWG